MEDSRKPKTKKKPQAPAELIGNIAEASRNARSIYILYSGLLAYCAITIVGTSDRQIVLNEPTTLPVIGVNVSLVGFFFLAPLLSLFFFVYLQLYLHKLKRLLDKLRSTYQPLAEDEKIYPWMLNFADELGRSGFVARTQRFIVNFSVWWSLPMVLILLSAWYLKTHDLFWGSITGIVPLVGALVVTAFWHHYQQPAGYRFKFTFPNLKSFIKTNRDKQALIGMVLLYEILFFALFVPAAQEGETLLGAWPCVNLSYQNLVSKKDTEFKELETMYRIDLRDARLQGADLTGVILPKADLRDADLKKARLVSAYLEKADLRGANLQDADMTSADLDNVKLDTNTVLRGTVLREASLAGIDLQNARLDSLNLYGANLEGANLQNTSLRGANLREVFLTSSNISYTKLQGTNFRGARLENTALIGIGSEIDTATDFRGALDRRDFDLGRVKMLFSDRDSIFGNWHGEGKIPKILFKYFRDKPDSLSADSVKRMLLKYDFYCADYPWTGRFSNPAGRGYRNEFELQREGQVVTDLASGLTWQRSGSDKYMLYAQTGAYIDSLNKIKFAGYDNWRLPTLEEAMSLMENTPNEFGLYINPLFDVRQPWNWTADRYDSSRTWFVNFQYGNCNYSGLRDKDGYVRAVRSGH